MNEFQSWDDSISNKKVVLRKVDDKYLNSLAGRALGVLTKVVGSNPTHAEVFELRPSVGRGEIFQRA